ncbi:MAG: hypothetical protein LBR85_02955 [Oscillospiraceae bacterium]|jgi:hypothetical protein|nr:hypothetical protein [Oscillospiraceae bacterium]
MRAKHIVITSALSLCICLLSPNTYAPSIIGEKDGQQMTNQPLNAVNEAGISRCVVFSNTESLSSILTKSYSLGELRDLLGEVPPTENYPSENPRVLRFRQINQKMPVECFRQIDDKGRYSVYKVSEGGYFYVFWNIAYSHTSDIDFIFEDYVVGFTAYLPFPVRLEAKDFDSIAIGLSTAEDVSLIDSAFELCFLMSGHLPSYSLLDDGSVMKICYDFKKLESRSDLVVISKEVVSKDDTVSKLALVLSKDLP